MPNIDERVVKMTFDNSEFEPQAKKSSTTLGRLKDALTELTSVAGNGLGNVMSKLDFKDLLKIGAGTTGIIALRKGLEGLKNDLGDFVEYIPNKVNEALTGAFQQIKTGGWSRAMKIENAKFLLKGLGLDEQTFMDAADYAVSGTAYSLDAAVSAAAQLGASGYDSFEELKYMLRGISGFAAMTNKSFEEIAYHWTMIAGMGRLTGGEITYLSQKGLNVAAELGKALGKTETEVKDLASKGQISFAQFAKAMDEAFGEHAKDANSTFEGASANINAALSRIGAVFATPYIQNIIPTLNGIRTAINAIKEALVETTIGTDFGNMIASFSNLVNRVLTQLNESLNGSRIIYQVSDAVSALFRSAKELLDYLYDNLENSGIISNIIYGLSVPIKDLIKLVDAVKLILETTFDKSNIIPNIYKLSMMVRNMLDMLQFNAYDTWIFTHPFERLLDLLKDIYGVGKEVFGLDTDSLAKASGKILDTFEKLLKSLTLTNKSSKNITDTFKSLFTAIKNVATSVYAIIDYALPKIENSIPYIFDNITGIVSSLAKAVEWVTEVVTQSELAKSIWENIKSIFNTVFKIFDDANVSFNKIFFGEDDGTTLLTKISTFVDSFELILNEALTELDLEELNFTPIKDFFLGLFHLEDGTGNPEETSQFLDNVKELLNKFGYIFMLFLNPIEGIKQINPNAKNPTKTMADSIKDFIEYILDAFMGLDKTHLDTIVDLANIVKDVIIALIWLVALISAELAGIIVTEDLAMTIKDGFKVIKETIEDILNGFSLLNAKEIGQVIGLATAAKKTTNSIFKNGIDLVGLIKAISWLMVAFAAALYVISEVSKNGDLMNGVKAFAIIAGVLAGVLALLLLAEGLINKFLPLASTKAFSIKGFKKTGKMKLKQTRFGGTAGLPGSSEINDFTGSLGGPWGSIAGAIFAVAIGMSAISVAMAILNVAVPSDGVGKFAAIAGIIAGLVTIIGAIITAVVIFTNKFASDNPKALALEIAAIGASVSAIMLSMSAMAVAIGALSILPNQNGVITAGMVLGLIAIAVTAIFGLAMSMVQDWQGALSGIALGAGILMALVGMSNAIVAFATAISMLSLLDPAKMETAAKTMKVLAIVLGVLGLLLTAMVIVTSLPAISEMAWIPILSLAGLFVSLTASFLGLSVTLIAMSAAALIVATAIDKYVESFENFVNAIMKLVNFAKRLTPEELKSTTDSLKMLGRATGEMVVEFAAGVLNGLATNISNILDDVWTVLYEIAKVIGIQLLPGALALIPMFAGAAQIIDSVLPDGMGQAIATRIWSLITDTVIPWIDSKWGEITETLSEFVTNIVDFVFDEMRKGKERISEVVDILVDWFSEFSKAFEANKDEISTSMTSIVDTILDVMLSVVLGNKASIKLENIGVQFVNGLAKGLSSFSAVSVIKNAMDFIGGKGDEEIRSRWGIHSPSTVAEKIGAFFVEGLGLGIGENSGRVIDAIDNLANNGLSSLKEQLSTSLNGLMGDVNPVITPELDLSSIKSGLGDMGSLFNNIPNVNAIFSARSSIDAMPNIQDLMNSVDSNYSNLIGTVYSIKPNQNPVPVNVNVSLEGDAKNMLKVMQKEDRRYTLAHGHSAFIVS